MLNVYFIIILVIAIIVTVIAAVVINNKNAVATHLFNTDRVKFFSVGHFMTLDMSERAIYNTLWLEYVCYYDEWDLSPWNSGHIVKGKKTSAYMLTCRCISMPYNMVAMALGTKTKASTKSKHHHVVVSDIDTAAMLHKAYKYKTVCFYVDEFKDNRSKHSEIYKHGKHRYARPVWRTYDAYAEECMN